MNYRDLLRRYVNHIIECESVTFIPEKVTDRVRFSEQVFTQNELDALHKIEQEIDDERTVDQAERDAKMLHGVIGNTPDSESGKSRFDP